MASSTYHPIDSASGEIRLLRILPAKKEFAEVQCEFIKCFLGKTPEYEALSYTWGGPAPRPGKYIQLNGHGFPIFENLFAALSRLRRSSKPRIMWIDALCINQAKDVEEAIREREQQILLMRQIYEQAEQVVIWLGEPSPGGDIAMQSLANPSGSLSLNTTIWKVQRKMGQEKGMRDRMSQTLTGEWDPRGLEVGEVAQLLDRKWWRRVWIVQEVVLARKAVLMCGTIVVPWEALKKRLRDGTFAIIGQHRGQLARNTAEGTVIAKYAFPDTDYKILDGLQDEWRSGAWNRSLYNLLYTFRRFEATKPRDRIFAFLGLAKDVEELHIMPDYKSTTSKVFIDLARTLIITHKHLLVFNLKRAPDSELHPPYQQTQLYSLFDQMRFLDTSGCVEARDGTHRKGWVRLPHGWERRASETQICFHNRLTGESSETSPVKGSPPVLPQRLEHWYDVPQGWTKTWDNVGNTRIIFNQDVAKDEVVPEEDQVGNLPSWVPDWSRWSAKDPTPFPSLFDPETRYWASGKSRNVHFSSGYDSDSNTLKLTGMSFDRISELAPAWCPKLHLLPIDRLHNKTLQAWEALATTPVPNCPYEKAGGRYNAYWRTHIADYAGGQSASQEDKNYFETWANRGEWVSTVPDNFNNSDKSPWQKSMETSTEQMIMGDMCNYRIEKGYDAASLNLKTVMKSMVSTENKYKEFRERIHNASLGRAMFVTEKGFIGLGPWNAQRGDVVSVLFGGCTPFLLRKVGAGKEMFTLVGEAYVYGIMGGELFSGEMGHPRLRAFDIV